MAFLIPGAVKMGLRATGLDREMKKYPNWSAVGTVLGVLDDIKKPTKIHQSGLYKLKRGESVHPAKKPVKRRATKGAKSKTDKGRKDYTTKKTSKFAVEGGHRIKPYMKAREAAKKKKGKKK